MAYVPQQIPDEEQNKFANPNQTTPNPVPPQGGSGSAGTSGGGRAAPGVASSTQFGSNAAKLSDYLNANKEQVGDFGNQVAGDLSNRYNQTMGAIDQGYGNFNQQVNQGYTTPDQSVIDRASQDSTNFVKDPNNVQQFQSLYNDQYVGPQNFEGSSIYSNINDQVNKAVSDANLVGSQGGLGTYLNNYLGANDTTEGMRTLDTALLQRDPGASTAIKSAAAPFSNLTNYLSTQTANANQNVAKAKTSADTTRTNLQNQFTGQNGVIPTLEGTLNDQLASTRSNATQQSQQAIQDFQAGKATPDELNILGLNNNPDLQNAYGTANFLNSAYKTPTDWNNIFTQTPAESVYATPGSAATPDQLARMQALSQLTGQDLSGFIGQTSPNGQMINPDIQGLTGLKGTLNQKDLEFVKSASLPTPEQISAYPNLGAQASQAAGVMNRLLMQSQDLGTLKNTINDPGKINWLLQYNNANPVQYLTNPEGQVSAMQWNGTKFEPYKPPPATPGSGVYGFGSKSNPGVF